MYASIILADLQKPCNVFCICQTIFSFVWILLFQKAPHLYHFVTIRKQTSMTSILIQIGSYLHSQEWKCELYDTYKSDV